jgi:hypothetical protein
MEYSCRNVYVDKDRFTPMGWFKNNVEHYWNYDMPEGRHLKVRVIGVQRNTRLNNKTTGFEFDETGLFNYEYGENFRVVWGLLEDSEMEYYNEYCAPEDRDLVDWFCKVEGFYKSDWNWLEI